MSNTPSQFSSLHCESCVLSKAHRSPFTSVREHATSPLQLVHSDLCGPLPMSLGKNIYFATFIDDYSRFCWVYLLQRKDAATIASVFHKWITYAENESGMKVKSLRTDGGGEYQKELQQILQSRGIRHQTTTPYSPQSNGIAERMNRSLNEAVRAMLFEAHMPQEW